MNSKIREFAEQAKNSVPAGLDTVEWIEKYNEIFAELIIEECTNKMYEVMENTEQIDLAYNAMLTAIVADIHKSFGIKENKSERFSKAFKKAFEGGADLSNKETP